MKRIEPVADVEVASPTRIPAGGPVTLPSSRTTHVLVAISSLMAIQAILRLDTWWSLDTLLIVLFVSLLPVLVALRYRWSGESVDTMLGPLRVRRRPVPSATIVWGGDDWPPSPFLAFTCDPDLVVDEPPWLRSRSWRRDLEARGAVVVKTALPLRPSAVAECTGLTRRRFR